MLDVVAAMATRPIIIALAIAGALLVITASLMKGSGTEAPTGRLALISRLGYALTFISITLFIVAGFLSDR